VDRIAVDPAQEPIPGARQPWGRVTQDGAELLRRGGAYAKVYEQQFQGGRVEAVCEDGMVLASGEVVAATPAA